MKYRTWPAAGMVALAAFACLPAAMADRKSDATLKKIQQTLSGISSLTGTMVVTVKTPAGPGVFNAELQLLRPGNAVIKVTGDGGMRQQTFIIDSPNSYIVLPDSKEYIKDSDAATVGERLEQLGPPIGAFFKPEKTMPSDRTVHRGSKKVNGATYEVVEVKAGPNGEPPATLYIGKSGLVEGAEIAQDKNSGITFWLKNIDTRKKLDRTQLAFRAPADYKELKQETAAGERDFEKGLIAVGAPAPSFDLPRPDGSRLSLEQALQGKKAVLLNFWFYG